MANGNNITNEYILFLLLNTLNELNSFRPCFATHVETSNYCSEELFRL
jgi:hypothetical protein